ncbi:D-Ala-D-Ala carboxypeptidase family metallohydrolase [Mesonia sp. HuA40]|uniref:D-Ala-D-Ala carboxypeptidase family metallohydrolase n=1 Tax=Mesonia sp. HuA40 TaxID=2602761 RepID=UPI0011CC2E14|nr:D-Ala-D-Ala carboxypeptidase family metallohydrolase [Mesonia sp. HuA40]TXK73958.1 hypothetical protein FT993_03610 [Mesonia sp. HuA40]
MNLNHQITENFKLSEFVLSDFYNDEQQQRVINSLTPQIIANIQQLAENLQTIRDEINAPISINIAFRPVWWEHLQGRSGRSQHTLGKAADIVCSLLPSELRKVIFRLIKERKIKNGGVGSYRTFTHYDIRETPARW